METERCHSGVSWLISGYWIPRPSARDRSWVGVGRNDWAEWANLIPFPNVSKIRTFALATKAHVHADHLAVVVHYPFDTRPVSL